MSFDNFPSDVILRIAKHLTHQDFLALSETCSRMNTCLTYGSFNGNVQRKIKNLKRERVEKLKTQIVKVKKDGRNIRYIFNPSHKIQLEAVKQYGYVAIWLPEAHEDVQIESLKTEGGEFIFYLKNPTEDVKNAALLYSRRGRDRLAQELKTFK